MEETLYEMIFKRKSFHLFKHTQKLTEGELGDIEEAFAALRPLVPDIRVALKTVPAKMTSCRRGQEYCLLLYSEKKENYLQNIGYIGEQLDLYLASRNIGALWFGIGKTEEKLDGMDFVIMLAIAKMPEDRFRRDMFKSKRKPLEEVWPGEAHRSIGQIARFAPSACNTQPWIVENGENRLAVYRYKKPGKRGIMPAAMVAHYNRIDIGIFLLFLELCLEHENRPFQRKLYTGQGEGEKTLTAVYTLR